MGKVNCSAANVGERMKNENRAKTITSTEQLYSRVNASSSSGGAEAMERIVSSITYTILAQMSRCRNESIEDSQKRSMTNNILVTLPLYDTRIKLS